VLLDEFNQIEHISVERFNTLPNEAKNIEICLSSDDQLPDGEFKRHLLTHISNEYEGRIIKLSDFLCFDFYGRSLTLKVSKVHTFPNAELSEQIKNLNINDEQFFHISSSTTWSIKNDRNENNDVKYPISNVGGLSNVYEKVMNIIQKTNHQSKLIVLK